MIIPEVNDQKAYNDLFKIGLWSEFTGLSRYGYFINETTSPRSERRLEEEDEFTTDFNLTVLSH